MKILGDVVLVTGAGQGIGRAVAHAFADLGLKVAVNALHEESSQRTCKELTDKGCKAVAVPADVGEDAAVQVMVKKAEEELGPIDILINNAAAPAEPSLFKDSTLETQNKELITLIGTLNCTRYVCTGMVDRNRGMIINISSLAGQFPMPTRAVYGSANAGIDMFTQTMAIELGLHGITVNAVSPGGIETPRFKARSKEIRAGMTRAVGLKRFGEPEEIADTVLFLASDKASYINGATIKVDGGFSGFQLPQ